jgi:hypothetical protein
MHDDFVSMMHAHVHCVHVPLFMCMFTCIKVRTSTCQAVVLPHACQWCRPRMYLHVSVKKITSKHTCIHISRDAHIHTHTHTHTNTFGWQNVPDAGQPGSVVVGKEPLVLNAGRRTADIVVTNLADRPIQVCMPRVLTGQNYANTCTPSHVHPP